MTIVVGVCRDRGYILPFGEYLTSLIRLREQTEDAFIPLPH